MKKSYGVNELRRMFLEFFESKEHLAMKSFSLVPHNDNSLLLINAGMAPLKPYFTGQEIPPKKRVTTCQKCIRTGEIERLQDFIGMRMENAIISGSMALVHAGRVPRSIMTAAKLTDADGRIAR